MTPAEKMAQRLNSAKCDEGVDGQMLEEAAAMIRRLAAALDTADKAMEKLSDGSTISEFRKVYADALRDVRDIPVEEQT